MRKPILVSLSFVVFHWVSLSCAQIKYQPLPLGDPEADQKATGLRYYATSLYLLVHSDGKGGIISRLLELPDVTKKMSLEVEGTLGSVDLKLQLKDGALTQSEERLRNDALGALVLDAAGGLAQSAATGLYRRGSREGREHTLPAPSIWKVLVRGTDIELLGGEGDAPIRVPLARRKRI